MPLGVHQASALTTVPPASRAQHHLQQLASLNLSHHGSSNFKLAALRSSPISDGLLGKHTPNVATASCSTIALTAKDAPACIAVDATSTCTVRGRQSSTPSSSGRPAETSPPKWTGYPIRQQLALSRGAPMQVTMDGYHSASGTISSAAINVWSGVDGSVSAFSWGLSVGNAPCCSSASVGGKAGGRIRNNARSSSVGVACLSRSVGGSASVLVAGGWGRRSGGGACGGWSSAGGRCFSAAAWGTGSGSGRGGGNGGSGGSSSEDGAGLPPPIIISPVALRVVVIGWMGSNRRYLNKYGSLWARSGDHEVLIVRPTVAQTLVRWRGVVVAGRDIDRVARLHRENPAMPTVYHVFSTGGFIHAGTMWRWMDEVEDVAQRRDLLEEVRGIILDSAPAAVNPAMSARAIVSAVTNTPAEDLSYDLSGWQGTLLNGTRSFMERYLQSKGVKLRTEEVYDAWYNLAPVCPQLYLYSDADPLVPTSDVEKYMGVQESRGVEVSGYKWPDSGHVEHFRRHPHEYAYQISAFLARALRDW